MAIPVSHAPELGGLVVKKFCHSPAALEPEFSIDQHNQSLGWWVGMEGVVLILYRQIIAAHMD